MKGIYVALSNFYFRIENRDYRCVKIINGFEEEFGVEENKGLYR
jgi:hypothetical protein